MLLKEAEEIVELASLASRARPTMITDGFSRLRLLPNVRQHSTWVKSSAVCVGSANLRCVGRRTKVTRLVEEVTASDVKRGIQKAKESMSFQFPSQDVAH